MQHLRGRGEAHHKHSSTKCRSCGHVDPSNRNGEKFICSACGFFAHADISAAKTIRDRALEMVRRDSTEPADNTAKRPKKCKEKSPRPTDESGEPGNLGNKDIKAAMS